MASGIFMQFKHAPLHVLGILLSSAFLASLVYRVFVGLFSPSLPSQQCQFFKFLGSGSGLGCVLCLIHYFFPLSF